MENGIESERRKIVGFAQSHMWYAAVRCTEKQKMVKNSKHSFEYFIFHSFERELESLNQTEWNYK